MYDEIVDVTSDDVRTVDPNLILLPRSAELESSDRSQLQVTPGRDGALLGSVRYVAQGADTVKLRIYSSKGTYISEVNGSVVLGMDGGDQRNPSEVSNAGYSPSSRKLYALSSKGWQVLEGNEHSNKGSFVPAADFNGAGLINYGVNLYASGQSGVKTALYLTRTAITHLFVGGEFICAEDFICTSIPSSATDLWVELNDLDGSLISSGGFRTSLAWVLISGTSLTTGPVKTESSQAAALSLPENQISSSASVKSSRSSSKASSAPRVSSPASGSSASKSSSKFEGVITSSQPSGRTKSASGDEPSESSESEPRSVTHERSEYRNLDDQNRPVIYDEEASPSQGLGTDLFMILYIILTAIFIFYLLILPEIKRRRK